jgi:hypothetical protein
MRMMKLSISCCIYLYARNFSNLCSIGTFLRRLLFIWIMVRYQITWDCGILINKSLTDSMADQLMPLMLGTTDDDVTWTRAKQWVLECTKGEDHHHCQKNVMAPRLPKRLVSISPNGQSTRLCLTSRIPNRNGLRYLALTHCWGKDPCPSLQIEIT